MRCWQVGLERAMVGMRPAWEQQRSHTAAAGLIVWADCSICINPSTSGRTLSSPGLLWPISLKRKTLNPTLHWDFSKTDRLNSKFVSVQKYLLTAHSLRLNKASNRQIVAQLKLEKKCDGQRTDSGQRTNSTVYRVAAQLITWVWVLLKLVIRFVLCFLLTVYWSEGSLRLLVV